MKCPKCGNQIPQEEKFCGKCGLKLPEYLYICPKCHNGYNDERTFCGECGEKLTNVLASQKASEKAKQMSPEEKKRQKKINIIALSIIAGMLLTPCIALLIVGLVKDIQQHDTSKVGSFKVSTEQKKESPTKKPTPKSTEKTTEKPTEPQTKKATEFQTEKPTEPQTEKPTEPPTEKPAIVNNSSAHGFWAEGNGDYVAEGLTVTDCAVLYFEYSGDSNFIVTLYQGDSRVGSLVNEIGSYSGSALVTGTGEYNLQIKSSGNWSIKSSGLEIDDSTKFFGHGNSVTGITTHGGGNWHLTHNGVSNFIVVPYDQSGKRQSGMVNEIGAYDGTVKAPKGNIFFTVKADGDWTIERQ